MHSVVREATRLKTTTKNGLLENSNIQHTKMHDCKQNARGLKGLGQIYGVVERNLV